MDRHILITQDANEKQVAILEDGKLEEFYIERSDAKKLFGNIYAGVVKTVVSGIDAAFVDIGTGKDGFLYVGDALRSPLDLDAEFDEAENGKEGAENVAASPEAKKPGEGRHREKFRRHQHPRRQRIEEVLKPGQKIIVQVTKEAIGNKGPRLTTLFSIPARYLVMMPGEQKIGVSRKIESKGERERIRRIFKTLEIPKDVGFIVRTNAEGKSEKEFMRDIRYLLRLWKKIHATIQTKKAPAVIHSELGLVERIIRDHVTEDTTKMTVDHPDIFQKVKRFLEIYMPGQKFNLHFSKEKGNLFERHNIEKEIERTFQKKVFLKSGGHIVIEQTEGLVAIDVNTGKFVGNNKGLEETVYKNNMEAALEIARQLRLRDVGGIVIIDFIDMESHEHRRNLYRAFKEALSKDRAKTHLLQISELGLVEMTRQRIRQSLESAVYDTCTYCEGKGMVKSTATMAIQAIRELRRALGETKNRIVNLYVRPEVAERLLQQEKKTLRHLERSTGSRISIFSEPASHREDINITFIK